MALFFSVKATAEPVEARAESYFETRFFLFRQHPSRIGSMNTASLDLFTQLLHIASPSGREEKLAAFVQQTLTEIGVDSERDPAGNVIVHLAGRDPDLPLHCYASHIDELGMVVTKVEADGTLRVKRSGGLYPFKLGEGPVEILGDERTITGVLSMGSMHRADAANIAVKWSDVWVMTGFSAEKLSQFGIRPGTLLTPANSRRGPVIFGDEADPLVGAWTFDDRLGVFCLLRLLKMMQNEQLMPLAPTLFAFTVSEEIGGLGAKSLCFREKPELFVSVDGSPMPPETNLTLDGRPCAWAKDRLAHYDYDTLMQLKSSALAAGTELQIASFDSAASDASLVSYAGLAPRIACIGHVRENSHGYEVIRLSTIENVVQTLRHFMMLR